MRWSRFGAGDDQAGTHRRLNRGSGADWCPCPNDQAAARCAPVAVRRPDRRPGDGVEPGRCRARPEPFGQGRQDARARRPGSAAAARRDQRVHSGWPARALIGLMVYSFARIGAATAMRVEDVYEKQRRLWVRLHEKGGKRHEMLCHDNLEAWLHAYIDGCGLAGQPKGGLFRTIGRGTGQLSDTPLTCQDARAMVRRRAEAAGISTRIGNHTFRATGITAYLKAGGTLERAAAMANHSSTRTTQVYDRRAEEMSLDEVERIGI